MAIIRVKFFIDCYTSSCCELEMAGIFNLSFAAGQLAIFAPSGIGVREFVVSFFANTQLTSNARLIVELALAHRLVWLVADFTMLLPLVLLPSTVFEKGN